MRLMNTPRSVDLSITNRCNLRCRYCAHFDSADDVGRDLPTQEWLQFFRELGACAVMDVCLCGGEPFLREDFHELIHGIVRNRMRFSILSNGTLITRELADFLRDTGRCNSIQVSIDGSSPATHDAGRGQGNFYRAMDGLKTLLEQGLCPSVRVTIHKHNVHDLEEVARLLLEELGLPAFSTNAASYMGLCRQNAESLQLDPQERFLAMETLLRLNQQYQNRIQANAGPLAEAHQWTHMEAARRDQLEALPGRGALLSCGGVFEKMAVRADGVMVPCNQLAHIELGRVNRDPLREVWQRHPELQRMRERRQIPLSDFPFCQGCPYLPYCPGGCPALAYSLLGKENHPSPDSCLWRYLQAGGRLPDERGLSNNPAASPECP